MQFQPNKKSIAIGYEDGKVECHLYDNSVTCCSLNTSIHSTKVTFLMWNPAGNRLITGDASGICCVWKADNRGSLAPSIQYRKIAPLTTAVFGTTPLRSELLARAFSPSFFFGSESGGVSYADDLGHCTDVQQLSSSIDSLMFYEEKMRLVIITRSLLMTQLQVNEDGRVTPVMKVKLSVAGDAFDRGVRNIVWAGPGLLASASGENMIRFWDLQKVWK